MACGMTSGDFSHNAAEGYRIQRNREKIQAFTNLAKTGGKQGWLYFITDQTKDITQAMPVHPKSKFNKNIANMFLCWRNEAIRKGKK